jgi:hypothetical protein
LWITRCADLDNAKRNLLVCRCFGESLDEERRQVLDVLVPKRSNGLSLGGDHISQDTWALFDDYATKDSSHRVCRHRDGVGGLKGPIGDPFHIHRPSFGIMDLYVQIRACCAGRQGQSDTGKKDKRKSRMN